MINEATKNFILFLKSLNNWKNKYIVSFMRHWKVQYNYKTKAEKYLTKIINKWQNKYVYLYIKYWINIFK